MNARICRGTIMHQRHRPLEHLFTFPYYFYVLDLDELDDINASVKIFSRNKWNIISIHDKDYLAGRGSIKEKILHYLQEAGCADGIFRIELVTNARYFGYVFNPVSFYYCYRQDGSVPAVVAEVNNTYGDRHLYVLDNKSGKKFAPIKITHAKEFHVSPFNDLKGHYEFSFEEPKGAFRISITLVRDEGVILEAVLSAEASSLTSATLTKTIMRYPITSFVTIPRIFIQALKLFFLRKLKFNDRPKPSSAMMIKRAE
jgi:cyclopropane-fatty-acyl-phospholipid synthase